MIAKQTILTPQGREKLLSELEHLQRVRRPEVTEFLRSLRDQSAGQTYAEFSETLNEAVAIDARIRELEVLLDAAEVVRAGPPGTVGIGSRVVVADDHGLQDQYTIVSPVEVDSRAGRISCESPVGRALLGRRQDEVVQAEAPDGRVELRILSVD